MVRQVRVKSDVRGGTYATLILKKIAIKDTIKYTMLRPICLISTESVASSTC